MPSRRDDPLLLTPLFTDRDGTVYTIMVEPADLEQCCCSRPTCALVLLAFALLHQRPRVLVAGALS